MEINNEKKKKGKSEREANPKSAGQDEQQRRITKAKGNDEENRAGRGGKRQAAQKLFAPKQACLPMIAARWRAPRRQVAESGSVTPFLSHLFLSSLPDSSSSVSSLMFPFALFSFRVRPFHFLSSIFYNTPLPFEFRLSPFPFPSLLFLPFHPFPLLSLRSLALTTSNPFLLMVLPFPPLPCSSLPLPAFHPPLPPPRPRPPQARPPLGRASERPPGIPRLSRLCLNPFGRPAATSLGIFPLTVVN